MRTYDEILDGDGLIGTNSIIRLGTKTAPSVSIMGKDTIGDFIDHVFNVMVCMEKEHFPTHGAIKLIVPLHKLLIGHVGITHDLGPLVARHFSPFDNRISVGTALYRSTRLRD
jgi:hypothetical protein